MAFYLLAVLWIQLPVMSRPPFVFLTGFNHWVFLLHNLAYPWRLLLTAVTTAVLVAGMVWLVPEDGDGGFPFPGAVENVWLLITSGACLQGKTGCC